MAISPGLGIIPLTWAVFSLLSILFCYFYAVAVGHVSPFVPSISNTGARRPEGDIFAEAMNLSSFLCLLIIVIRHLQLEYRAGTFYENLWRLNMYSLVAGSTCAFGVTLIANFPSAEDATTSSVHDIGAVLTFVSASSYCTMQTFLTWRLLRYEIDDRFSWIYRLILTFIMTVAGLLFLLLSLVAYQEFEEKHGDHKILKWGPGDGGYFLHVFSNVFEWVAAGSFILFITSYFKEFQELRIVTKCLPRCSRRDSKSLNEFEELHNSS